MSGVAAFRIERRSPVTAIQMTESPPEKIFDRRALLIGVSTTNTGSKSLAVGAALTRVARVLEERHGFVVERREDDDATRSEILRGLDAWIADCRDADAGVCLFYYFGHGGRIEFTDLEGHPEHEFGYVTCRRIEPRDAGGRQPFEGVLGFELSVKLSALAQRGRSVVAILDCCYAGQLVRHGRRVESVGKRPTPDWVRTVLATRHDELAIDSHPDIVRLAGSTPKRESFAQTRPDGQIGVMTKALLATLDEWGEDWQLATWDAMARRVRQRVIDDVGEGQWVSFAGPREQRLFSPDDVAPLRTVGLVVDTRNPRSAWLRVGALQGVEVGERWAVTSPFVEDGRAREPLTIGAVDRVELNHAHVQFDEGVDVGRLRSNCAHRVELDENERRGPHLLAALSALARAPEGRHDRELPFAWSWGVARIDGEQILPSEGATIFTDDRIWFRFEAQTRRARHWFVNVIHVDAAGELWQLNGRLPQGIELGRGDREQLGLRVGARQQGLRLQPVVGPAKLLMLATSLPLELDHLVRTPDRSTADALLMQGLRSSTPRDPVRGHGPRPPDWLERWAHRVIDFEIQPGSRPK